MIFKDRNEAGNFLSQKLTRFKKDKNTAVLSILRGGIVVGFKISKNLNLPLFPLIVKKLRAPDNPELAIGAVTLNNTVYLDLDIIETYKIAKEYIEEEVKRKKAELKERLNKIRIGSHFENYRRIILVDDGIATGATVLCAVKYIRNIKPTTHNPQLITIILAVPVVAKEVYNKLRFEADEMVVLETPDNFNAVGQFYREFSQVGDEEVIKIINR